MADFDTTQTYPAPEDDDVAKTLAAMTSAQRVNFFRPQVPKTEALQDFGPPHVLCKTYPHYHSEVMHAYRKYTTFTVKVWTNYDTACKQFFVDKRLDSCGKMIMTPQQLSHLEEVMTDEPQLARIRLEIGTPFKTLCWLSLRVQRPDPLFGSTIKATYQPQTGTHPRVMEFVEMVQKLLDGLDVLEGRDAFALEDIEQLCGIVRRQPGEGDLEEDNYRGGPPLWMDLSRDSYNEGWTDFGRLEALRPWVGRKS